VPRLQRVGLYAASPRALTALACSPLPSLTQPTSGAGRYYPATTMPTEPNSLAVVVPSPITLLSMDEDTHQGTANKKRCRYARLAASQHYYFAFGE